MLAGRLYIYYRETDRKFYGCEVPRQWPFVPLAKQVKYKVKSCEVQKVRKMTRKQNCPTRRRGRKLGS
jgi:hypothetical protein